MGKPHFVVSSGVVPPELIALGFADLSESGLGNVN